MKEIKCIVWDLDNTIWHGILLEDKNVRLKEGITDIFKTLDSRGILHSISSKNHYDLAFAKLEEFGLSEYFLYPEINWNNKSASIKNISKNLNIGFDTILFIDDQEYERDEVKYNFPGVHCIDAAEYETLLDKPALNPRFITEDSKRRRKMYVEDINRKRDEENYAGPEEEFLKLLQMQLKIKKAGEDDFRRLEELTVRTHQLNTTGYSYNYNELKELLHSDNHILLTAELTDVYGSYGKIGLVLIKNINDEWRIKLFILSCRVMNRGIGTVLLNEIINSAASQSKKLSAEFFHTDRNRIMYVTLKFANFIEAGEDVNNGPVLLRNDLSVINPNPPYINLISEKKWN